MRALPLDSITTDFFQTVKRVAPAHYSLAQQTLDQLLPSQWALEWHLPWWLGNGFGLAQGIARQFALSNVLGLVSIRLEDDLADDDVPVDEQQSARELAHLLYDAALEIYRPHFGARSEFWNHVRVLMNAWRAASVAVNQLNLLDLNSLEIPGSVSHRVLADLGAPLKIGATAICLLTEHQTRLPALNALLDHALIAAVLNDHAMDWEQDLHAGRRNIFVAAISALPQTESFYKENRARVVKAWMLSDTPGAYFEQVAAHAQHARSLSQACQLAPFTAYLEQFALNARQTLAATSRYYREQLSLVTAGFFGAPRAHRKRKEERQTTASRVSNARTDSNTRIAPL